MSENNSYIGNVTRDPELRFTTGGTGVAGFGLAVNRRFQANGEWKEQVSFFDIVAWGELAENVTASFTKGDRVIVVGRLEQERWENKDGDKRSKVQIVATDVGAATRFATVEITKIERQSSTDQTGSATHDTSNEEAF